MCCDDCVGVLMCDGVVVCDCWCVMVMCDDGGEGCVLSDVCCEVCVVMV